MTIYLEHPNAKGNSTTEGFKDMIVLNSVQWGAMRNIKMPHRTNASREADEPSLSEVTVTTSVGAHTANMFVQSVASDLSATCKIHFVTADAKKATEYLMYTLTNVGVSQYHVSAGADNLPMETIGLNYDSLSIKVSSLDPKLGGSPVTVGFDLTKMATT
jgi:type VI secretion system secreted protein Hcp